MGIDLATHIYFGMRLEDDIDPEYPEENYEAIDEAEKKYGVNFQPIHWDYGDHLWLVSAKEADVHPEWDLVPLVLPTVDTEDAVKRIREFTKALELPLKDEPPQWWITSYWW